MAKNAPQDGKIKKPAVSRSEKAVLKLSVSRVHRQLKDSGAIERIGINAPVFMAAVLQYVATEVIEMAAENTTQAKRKRIMPEDISQAIRSDPELHKAMEGFRMFTGDKHSALELFNAITCEHDKKRKKEKDEAAKAAKEAAKAAKASA